MKRIIFVVCGLAIAFSCVGSPPATASPAGEEALFFWIKQAYHFMEQATQAPRLTDARFYASKAKSAAEKARTEALHLGLELAAMHLRDAYYYALQVKKTYTLDLAHSYAKKAMRAAEDGRIAAARRK